MRKTQIDRPTDRLADMQTDGKADRQSVRQSDRQTEKLRCANISKEITKKRMRERHVPSTQKGRERWMKKGRGS